MSCNTKKTSYCKGLLAEQYVAQWLRLKDYKILEMRYKTSWGEIDIIATKEKSLHFIEVKQRPTATDALMAITASQRRRIENAAQIYMAQAEITFENIYFDAIIVCNHVKIHHMIDAWRMNDSW